MKKPPSPSDPESAKELAQFYEAMKAVKPLQHDRTLLPHRKSAPNRYRQQQARDVSPAKPVPALPPIADAPEILQFVRKEVDKGLWQLFQRGKIPLQATLNLRGMTLTEAEQALQNCLARCQQAHVRSLRIIHGKGRHSAQNKPIVKSALNHWLPQIDAVLAFCSAPPNDGGTGVTYILLKRE